MRLRVLGGYEIRTLDVPKLGPAALDRFLVETGRMGDLNDERDSKQRTARSDFLRLYWPS